MLYNNKCKVIIKSKGAIDMTKKNIMKQAHKLAKQIVEEVGDYTIALSLALKRCGLWLKKVAKR